MDSFLAFLTDLGVEGFYTQHGNQYYNPREYDVKKSIHSCFDKWLKNYSDKFKFSKILDLACGSGEATLAIQEWTKSNNIDIEEIVGTDPFTYEAFEKRVGRPALKFSFEDIENGILEYNSYDMIICTFALHLVEQGRLFSICNQMALVCKLLVIVSPHKRPILTPEMGWICLDECKVERTKTRLYESKYFLY